MKVAPAWGQEGPRSRDWGLWGSPPILGRLGSHHWGLLRSGSWYRQGWEMEGRQVSLHWEGDHTALTKIAGAEVALQSPRPLAALWAGDLAWRETGEEQTEKASDPLWLCTASLFRRLALCTCSGSSQIPWSRPVSAPAPPTCPSWAQNAGQAGSKTALSSALTCGGRCGARSVRRGLGCWFGARSWLKRACRLAGRFGPRGGRLPAGLCGLGAWEYGDHRLGPGGVHRLIATLHHVRSRKPIGCDAEIRDELDQELRAIRADQTAGEIGRKHPPALPV